MWKVMQIDLRPASYYWEKIEYVHGTITDWPVEFEKNFNSNIYNFTNALIKVRGLQTNTPEFAGHYNRISEAVTEILAEFTEWHLNSLRKDEENLTKYANTSKIVEKFKHCESLRKNAKDATGQSKFPFACDKYWELEECLREIDIIVTTEKTGLRGQMQRITRQRTSGVIVLIVSIIGALGFNSISEVFNQYFLGFGQLITGTLIVLLLGLGIIFIWDG